MQLNRLSMRVSLIATIVVMGSLSVALALVSGGVYHNLALDSQRTTLEEQITSRVSDLRKDMDAESQRLALLVQQEPGFLTAFRDRDSAGIGKLLDTLLARPGSVSMRMKLMNIHVLDNNLNPLASSDLSSQEANLFQPPCQGMAAQTIKRAGSDFSKTMSSICAVEGKLYYLYFQPFGDKRHNGYLQMASDMIFNLAKMDIALGMPVKLSLINGTVLYQSTNWPEKLSGTQLATEQTLSFGASVKSTLNVSVLKDVSALQEQLTQTARAILFAVAAATALSILIALRMMQHTVFGPLYRLTEQLRKVRHDKSHLGQRVVVGGNAEMIELSAGFNDMTTRLKELYESLESLAFTDPLTKLPNRTLFHDKLLQAIDTAKRDYKPFALFIMDLDRFKDINDTLGHHVRDVVLQQVAARLRSKLRETDVVARMGGDEFAVMLPTATAKHADMAARMLLQALRAPIQVEHQVLDVGASIGIALYPDHGVDANILIQRADVAMYAANTSNAGHVFYETKLDQHNPSRLVIMGELRQAVEQEQFELYYQPKVNLKSHQVTGVEALARWHHPNDGLVLPDAFIPLLEQTGLIRSLTPWVLHASLQQGQRLRSLEMPITISMNLSVRDLQDPYLVDTFTEQLAALQISPRWLELEITESAVMTDPAHALEMLSRLSAMGLKLSIDDFGTGYSSLSYLKKLPVDAIKIDKSFVIGMVQDVNDAAIVRTSIDLAHNLGMEAIAEGVESEEALERLIQLGCDTVQGHYISRPLSADELEQWLKQSTWNLDHNRKLLQKQG